MKYSRHHHILPILMIWTVLLYLPSCNKDKDAPEIIPPVHQRIVEILAMEGGMEEYKEVYHYDDQKLTAYYKYRYDAKGNWKKWIRHVFAYPSEDVIIQTKQGLSDSEWFNSNKYERYFYGDKLQEMIFYDSESPEIWKPVRKITWKYEDERLTERLTFKHTNGCWALNVKDCLEYTGNLWTCMRTFKHVDGDWDTIAQTAFIYQGGKLSEVNVYEYRSNKDWTLREQYVLNYETGMLAAIEVREEVADTLLWDRTLYISYNEHAKPVSYTIDHVCCPTQTFQLRYEMDKGNYRQATQELSEIMPWPLGNLISEI